MKREKFVGKLIYCESLHNSNVGGPAYFGVFMNDKGDVLRGRTTSNAECAWGFRENAGKLIEVTYHYTRKGNVRFDYIKKLKGETK